MERYEHESASKKKKKKKKDSERITLQELLDKKSKLYLKNGPNTIRSKCSKMENEFFSCSIRPAY